MKKKSRRLFPIIAVVCAVCFGSLGSLFAGLDPYISITLPDVVDFGSIPNPGTHDFSHTFPMEVVANVPYHVEIVLSDLTNGGATIVPTGLQMIAPAGFGQMGARAGDVPVELSVNTTMGDLTGVYNGTLTVTIEAE